MGPDRYAESLSNSEPEAARKELAAEKRRREELERRVEDLMQESRRSQRQAEEAERDVRVREALREQGVKKVDLAFRLVKDDVLRGQDGRLYAESGGKRAPLEEHIARFLSENPEFLPPRIAGGSGASGAERREMSGSGFDMESIRPGMSKEESRQAWKEVARLMGQGSQPW